MRVAIQNPGFLFADQARNFDGYNFAFVKKYKPALYLTSGKAWLSRGLRWKQALVRAGLQPADFEFVYDLKDALPKSRRPVVFQSSGLSA